MRKNIVYLEKEQSLSWERTEFISRKNRVYHEKEQSLSRERTEIISRKNNIYHEKEQSLSRERTEFIIMWNINKNNSQNQGNLFCLIPQNFQKSSQDIYKKFLLPSHVLFPGYFKAVRHPTVWHRVLPRWAT